MKTAPLLSSRSTRAAALAAAFGTLALFPAFAESATNAAAPKDHTLFVGSDISISHEGKMYRLVGVTARALQFESKGEIREVPLKRAKDLHIARGVKLSKLTADISPLRSRTTNRRALADENESIQEAMLNSMALTDIAGMRRDKAYSSDLRNSMANLGISPSENIPSAGFSFGPKPGEAGFEEALHQISRTFDPAVLANQNFANDTHNKRMNEDDGGLEINLDVVDPGNGSASKLVVETKGEPGDKAGVNRTPATNTSAGTLGAINPEADGVAITFEVSSPQPLSNAYVVMVLDYTLPEKPGQTFFHIATQAIGELGATPVKVEYKREGFPAGFAIAAFRSHVYANGQEIATNRSEKQMKLTKDEAHQYFVLEYLVTNPGKSRPPAPFLMTPRAEIRQFVKTSEVDQTLYATVDKKGAVVALTTDDAGAKEVPPAIIAAMDNVRFVPAIDNGLPVDGRAKFNLAELIR